MARSNLGVVFFCRATSSTCSEYACTAAIRGEESLKGVGLERQLRITMENIAELIADAKLVKLRVYLKNKSDYEEAERLMNTYGLNIPISYMWADVCRDELLIEIEGIAIR